MNTKSKLFNPNVFGLTILSTLGVLSISALAFESKQSNPQYEVHAALTEYSVQTIKLTSDTSGIAVIKLDGFRVQVGFDFEAHEDNYGVVGSDFTSVEITNLAVDHITDVNGHEYNDFTDYNDHRNINQLLSAFIEKNQLVEAA